jgi:hypothetical protein
MAASSFLQTARTAPTAADSPWSGVVSASLGIEPGKLAAFSRGMAEQGFALDTLRLFFDATYAYKRLALAHTCNDERLQALAVELFEQYRQLERRRHDVSAFSRPH